GLLVPAGQARLRRGLLDDDLAGLLVHDGVVHALGDLAFTYALRVHLHHLPRRPGWNYSLPPTPWMSRIHRASEARCSAGSSGNDSLNVCSASSQSMSPPAADTTTEPHQSTSAFASRLGMPWCSVNSPNDASAPSSYWNCDGIRCGSIPASLITSASDISLVSNVPSGGGTTTPWDSSPRLARSSFTSWSNRFSASARERPCSRIPRSTWPSRTARVSSAVGVFFAACCAL